MTKKIVHMRISEDLHKAVSDMAESDHGGVFTAAVESLLAQALMIRAVDEQLRWVMYGAAKNETDYSLPISDYSKLIKNMTGGLNL